MKNLALLLIFTPIFLITALNFHEKNDSRITHENNRFTCSSCHATIIDGIIVGGKKIDMEFIRLELIVETYSNPRGNLVLERKEDEKVTFSSVTAEFLDQYLILERDEDASGKKETTIQIEHRITDEERLAGFIEIQGVFSDLDGTEENDFAFSKKISINDEEIVKNELVRLFPSVANSFVQLENLVPNDNILIFNAIGQQVYTKQNISEVKKIDVSTFENGNYFVLVNQKQQLRFIVSK